MRITCWVLHAEAHHSYHHATLLNLKPPTMLHSPRGLLLKGSKDINGGRPLNNLRGCQHLVGSPLAQAVFAGGYRSPSAIVEKRQKKVILVNLGACSIPA